jgi:hypothetical protein
MKTAVTFPSGHRILGEVIAKTDKAILFEYHGWHLWIPKSKVVKIKKGPYTAPYPFIDSAKTYAETQAELRSAANEFDVPKPGP